MDKPPYVNHLSISPYCKTIPYEGNCRRRANGRINHGFKNLRTNPNLIDTVPELMTDDSMRELVKTLNTKTESFFTAGCFSHYRLAKPVSPTDDALGYYEGYVEFAFNCHLRVQDAKNYFALFFHFDQFLEDIGFQERVKFDWLIGRIHFTDLNVEGFSTAVFLQTATVLGFSAAQQIWNQALNALDGFLGSVQPQRETAMYSCSQGHNHQAAA
ncbi:MAG: hypothetical protein AAFQ61_04545 [Cyanobacteria bacterium J06626_23]